MAVTLAFAIHPGAMLATAALTSQAALGMVSENLAKDRNEINHFALVLAAMATDMISYSVRCRGDDERFLSQALLSIVRNIRCSTDHRLHPDWMPAQFSEARSLLLQLGAADYRDLVENVIRAGTAVFGRPNLASLEKPLPPFLK